MDSFHLGCMALTVHLALCWAVCHSGPQAEELRSTYLGCREQRHILGLHSQLQRPTQMPVVCFGLPG